MTGKKAGTLLFVSGILIGGFFGNYIYFNPERNRYLCKHTADLKKWYYIFVLCPPDLFAIEKNILGAKMKWCTKTQQRRTDNFSCQHEP
jgi:hypothetical protein